MRCWKKSWEVGWRKELGWGEKPRWGGLTKTNLRNIFLIPAWNVDRIKCGIKKTNLLTHSFMLPPQEFWFHLWDFPNENAGCVPDSKIHFFLSRVGLPVVNAISLLASKICSYSQQAITILFSTGKGHDFTPRLKIPGSFLYCTVQLASVINP